MRKFVLTLLAALAVAALWPADAEASGYYNGYVTPAGYRYLDGYWYYGSQAYTRSWVPGYYTTYYRCGYPYQYYVDGYYSYYAVPTYSAPAVSYATPNWRSELIKLAAARDKSVLEQQGFVESVNALGLGGNFRVSNYGQYASLPLGVSYFNNAIVGNYGASGNTLYGFKASADLYGSTDLNSLYQQASRLALHGQDLGGQATQGFQALASQAGANAAAVAEIQSKGQALLGAIQAAGQAIRPEPRGTGTVTTYSYGTAKSAPVGTPASGKPGVGLPAPEAPGVDLEKQYVALVEAKCAACHVGDKAKGKFDLNKMTPEQRLTAIDRITSEDPKLLMPRDAADETKPGTPLTAGEQLIFFKGSKR